MKTLEQRLYEAYRERRGLRLSDEGVCDLVHDDAVGTRISNQAQSEAGVDEWGESCVWLDPPTWKQFVESMKQ